MSVMTRVLERIYIGRRFKNDTERLEKLFESLCEDDGFRLTNRKTKKEDRRMTTLHWPSFFPDACPPPDASEASAEVFRLVAFEPPSASDFESHRGTVPR